MVDLPSGRTAWARNLAAPVRDFLSTESAGAAALLARDVAALAWANSPWSHSYESVWTTELSIRARRLGHLDDLRDWVNEGLMTFFFLVVGLEAKRELDLGPAARAAADRDPGGRGARRHGGAGRDLPRVQRRRLAAPTAGAPRCRPTRRSRSASSRCSPRGGDASARAPAHAGGRRRPRGADRDRHGVHGHVSIGRCWSRRPVRCAVRAALRSAAWRRRVAAVARRRASGSRCTKSGIDPVIAGLAVGLVTSAYPPARGDLERGRASSRARSASSRRPGSPAPRSAAWRRRSRPTTASSTASTRGRAS